jgi:hypothetical protein
MTLSVQAAANRRGILAMIGAMTSFVINDAEFGCADLFVDSFLQN